MMHASLPWSTAMWLAMMGVMMAPSVWPWIQAFRRILLDEAKASYHDSHVRSRAIRMTASFVAGYLLAWLPYSIGAAFLQHNLAITGVVASAVLVGAGLFQFVPAKRACLRHCRNPVTYFLARWRNRPASGLRIGFAHGVFCVGCCWALMATALAVGIMNLWWMLALSVTAFAEQVSPRGDRVRVVTGVVLILAGLAIAFA